MEVQYKILIISDTPPLCKAIKRIFLDQNKILHGKYGQEGIMLAQAEVPEIIFIQFSLADTDSILLCQDIRKLPAPNAPPDFYFSRNQR